LTNWYLGLVWGWEVNGAAPERALSPAFHLANTEHGVTGEDIRRMLLPHVGHPASPNAWGALVNSAVRKAILKPTGHYRPMKDVRSHARKTAVYEFGRGL
jgi:hypothetical protein